MKNSNKKKLRKEKLRKCTDAFLGAARVPFPPANNPAGFKKWAGEAGLLPLIAEVRAGRATFNPPPAGAGSLPRDSHPRHVPALAHTRTDRHTDTRSEFRGARRGWGARSERPQQSPAGTRGHGCCSHCPGQSALPAPASSPAPEPENGASPPS